MCASRCDVWHRRADFWFHQPTQMKCHFNLDAVISSKDFSFCLSPSSPSMLLRFSPWSWQLCLLSRLRMSWSGAVQRRVCEKWPYLASASVALTVAHTATNTAGTPGNIQRRKTQELWLAFAGFFSRLTALLLLTWQQILSDSFSFCL